MGKSEVMRQTPPSTMMADVAMATVTLKISCVLNGVRTEVPAGTTIDQIYDLLQIDRRGSAVEINAEVVPRSEHATRVIVAGDHVEIVRMVGGG